MEADQITLTLEVKGHGVPALCTRSLNFRGRSEMDLFMANMKDLRLITNESKLLIKLGSLFSHKVL